MLRSERAERFARIEEEVAREKAAALGRAGERLEAALAEVAELARAFAGAGDAPTRERLAGEYEGARRQALAARTALLIQREALGLRQHRAVDQHFPEPPPRP